MVEGFKMRVDNLLESMISIAEVEVAEAKSKNFFSKEFSEAICIIISVAIERMRIDEQISKSS